MGFVFLLVLLLLPPLPISVHAEGLGKLSANSFNVHSTAHPRGRYRFTASGPALVREEVPTWLNHCTITAPTNTA